MKNINVNTTTPILCILSVGVVLAPVQSAIGKNLDMSLTDFSSKVQSEQHTPHFHTSPGDHYYADPRALRAVGYDTGKSDRGKQGRDNWDIYNQRLV
jgi:hypothetical protein